MGRTKRTSKRSTLSLLLVFLILAPLLLALPEVLTPTVSAASNCNYDSANSAEWHEEISSFNLTGTNDFYAMYGDEYRDESPDFGFGGSLGDNIYNDSSLDALRSDFYTSFEIKNDTASGLRLNLTSGYRYTFCFTTHSENTSNYLEAPLIDFYLLQKYDWDFYRNDYNARLWEERELLNLIPPEWRDLSSWMPYRDVHAYESKKATDFAVSLDHDETSGGFFGFGEENTEWMYLIIDGWDNMRDSDTPAPHRNFSVDITIMTEERLTLPNYTVSLFCCGLFAMLLAAPVIMHTRFQSAGMGHGSSGQQGVDLMPMLETEATKPPPPR
ncbi:MAG: DUF2946 domain-containing protein [Euryarchaeota archaeon]|jgi:hypothetical protein|nr:DUF2946 domain-containing protein [Euryarchaeota archaeon]